MDELTRQEVQEIARREAGHIVTDRSTPAWPAYFVNGRWLVTYDWLLKESEMRRTEIELLKQRIERLEGRWWKRWWR